LQLLHAGRPVLGGWRDQWRTNPLDRAAEWSATGTILDLDTSLVDVVARLPAWVEVTVTDGVRDRTTVGSARIAAIVAMAAPEWIIGHLV
jgi:hypothetical protein